MKIDDVKSENYKPNVCMPHGRVLSQLLFIFFCADMFNDCVGKPFKYADGATLVTAAETVEASNLAKQECCNKIRRLAEKMENKSIQQQNRVSPP